MLKQTFKNKLEFDIYLAVRIVDKRKGWLTVSERKQLEPMLDKDYKPNIIVEEKKKIAKPLVTNYAQLRIPCEPVTKNDDIKGIVQDLKDGLDNLSGIGISGIQIGINKKISYIRIPQLNEKKQLEMKEIILINPKIIEHSRSFIFKGEGCTSFPGLRIDTDRFVFITVVNYNEKLEPNTFMSQDLEGVCIAHEIDHCNGIVFLSRKHRTK